MIPLRAINRERGEGTAKAVYIADFSDFTPEVEELVKEADIVILQRVAVNKIINSIIRTKYEFGKPIAIDIDDGYHHMSHKLRAYDFWRNGIVPVGETEDGKEIKSRMAYPPLKQLEWGVKLTNVVTTPSHVLAEDWCKFTPNTFIVPNYIETSSYLPYKKAADHDKLRLVIGWGGSGSHYLSWMESHIIPAIRRVLQERKDVEFILAASLQSVLNRISHKSFEARVKWIDWGAYADWPETLSQFDIGLIPMYGEYDERRSWIKPLEYALMGIPWVGSRNRMTEEYVGFGGQVVENKTSNWYEAIVDVVDHYKHWKECAEADYNWAIAQGIDQNVDRIMDTYEEICSLS